MCSHQIYSASLHRCYAVASSLATSAALASVAVTLLCTSAIAQVADNAPGNAQPSIVNRLLDESIPAQTVDKAEPQRFLVSAKHLAGATIVDRAGTDMGDVSVIYLTVDGKLVHLTMELGSVLGLGGSAIAIPLSAVGLRDTDDSASTEAWLSLELTKEVIEKAPPLEARNQLELRDEAWVAQNAKFFNVQQTAVSESSAEASLTIPAADLLDHTVLGQGDTATIAHVEDLLLGLGNGQEGELPVRYAILGYGGTLGIGTKYVAIPFNEVKITMLSESELKVEVPYNSKSLAEQQLVTPDDYPELKLNSVRRRIERQRQPTPARP